uniref:DUF2066 domain-containing protein n=1 Tax=Candidatus Kentrum sp. DK TaxID=2126562 RepID=A0A450T8Q5_9GAMM|nr:MAG: hypothetical protein BECKDK2373B_GA0170837_11194 [Candidatus Kentron sp. DK]
MTFPVENIPQGKYFHSTRQVHATSRDRIAAWLVCIAFAITVGVTHAAEVRGLYEAEVLVPDKGEQEQEIALQEALRQVIGKVAGKWDGKNTPVIAEALKHPERYVEQFLYRKEERLGGGPSSQHRRLLQAKFDPSAINELLRSAHLSQWGHTRPSMLIWLAVEDGNEHVLLGDNDRLGLSKVLRQGAAERGIPIMLPLLDLDDLSRIDEADVRNRSRGRIFAASERYTSDTLLIGQLSAHSTTEWEAHWELLSGTGIMLGSWMTRADNRTEALRKGVVRAADLLISRYTIPDAASPADEPASELQLTVSGIDTITDYARTVRYLENLQPQGKVYVTRAAGERISFRLAIPGGKMAFIRMVRQGNTLTEATNSQTAHINDPLAPAAPLAYHLLP